MTKTQTEKYIVLLRGVNVGGKNTVSMSLLKTHLEAKGYRDVSTYINSGNVIVKSTKTPNAIKDEIEQVIIGNFTLDSTLIKVLVLSYSQLEAIIDNKPKGFGEQPDLYHSDIIFLIDISIETAMAVFNPREGVDKIWPGADVIYSQRLSAERTKSRLGKIIATKPYASMTIRNWNTTLKLQKLILGSNDSSVSTDS